MTRLLILDGNCRAGERKEELTWEVVVQSLSHVPLLGPCGLQPTRLFCPWNSPSENTGIGCHALLQGIFPTQESNPHLLCLLHWQAGSLPLAPRGKPLRQIYDIIFANGKLRTKKVKQFVQGHMIRQRQCWDEPMGLLIVLSHHCPTRPYSEGTNSVNNCCYHFGSNSQDSAL